MHFFSLDEWLSALDTPEFNPMLVKKWGAEKDPYRLFAVMAPVKLTKSVFYDASESSSEVVVNEGAED